MNAALRRIAFFVGLGVLGVSIFWSQDGFNFDVAGDSGYGTQAILIGYFLALVVTVLQFVLSSNFQELNTSLIFFGIMAYAYSIFTNYQGIMHFQGGEPNKVYAGILAIFMDAAAEPLIAWGLYVSRDGDLIGNLIKALFSAPDKLQEKGKTRSSDKSGGFGGFGQKSDSFGGFSGKTQKRQPNFKLHGVNLKEIERESSRDDTKPFTRN